MFQIGVILCTRGLVFTEVDEALDRNLEGLSHKIYRSYNLPIPDCQNVLVERALKEGCEYLLFVEEDTVMPEEAVVDMIDAKADIACIDYGVNGWGCVTRDTKTDEVLWCGLGCTLIHSKVFKKLSKPYFRSDKGLLMNYWPEIRWIDTGKQAYGGQDIYFCIKARDEGFKIVQVPGECRHLKLVELGKPEINRGLHHIEQKPLIENHQVI